MHCFPWPARLGQYALVALAVGGLAGCVSPVTLNHAVMAYDEVTTDLLSRQLLLNIARARHHHPIHFTGVSNIAATFNFQVNAGVTPALTGNNGGLLMPLFGGSAAENPTISIVPIEGEEFTRRLLTPIQENKLTMLLRQGTDIDLVLRLITSEFRMYRQGEVVAFSNRPSDRGYATFRRLVLHLSSIQDRNALYVEPLQFRQSFEYPADQVTPEALAALQKEFAVDYDASKQLYRLSKPVTGRIVITNYDPNLLSNDERIRLNEAAETSASDELTVDIRADYPGGEYPIHGKFRLRSFHNILNFLGRGIAEEQEYDVPKDPRTPEVAENPVSAMGVLESERAPSGADLAVKYQGHYYAVRPDTGYPWNREAFRLLSQLFQMTVTELPQLGVPSITIAK